MIASMFNVRLYGHRLGVHVSLTERESRFGSATLIEDNEPVNILAIPPDAAENLIKGLEQQLEWYRTDYCQWAKRKTT